MNNSLRAACILAAAIAGAQTRVDLRTQSKNVDFSGAASTKPFRSGASLPTVCSAGEVFFKADATPGENLYACTATNVWTLQSGSAAGGGGAVNYSHAFTNQSTVVISGSAHKLGSANLLVDCYDAGTPATRINPTSVSVNATTYDITVVFAGAQSGRCVVNGSGGAGSGAVASVFGRTGAVIGAAGDYQFSQVAGTVSDAQLAGGIDAAKIGAGSVSNTAFGYLSNVRADLQGQIDGKAAGTHSHATAGDTAGDVSAMTVTGIQGRPVSSIAPSNGQALVWSDAAAAWQPASGGAGDGAGMAVQLGDFAVTISNPTVLSIGSNCSVATPCNARFGSTVYSFTRGCAATISGGAGTAFVYIASGGLLTVGHNVTASASAGCYAQPGVTDFPQDSIPLYTWTATDGAWDADGGRDFRSMLSAKSVLPGTGITTMETGGRTTVSVDTALVPSYAAAETTIDFPAIAGGTCSADQSMTVYGASAGDTVAAGWPGGLQAGLFGVMRVSAANTVAVRLCNITTTTIDPAPLSYRAAVIRSF